MTAFSAFLREKLERYIELRRSLGYAFNKQAGTLRAFVRHVERSQADAPATRTMALDFVLSFRGAANSRAIRHGVLRRFYEYLAVYDPKTEVLELRVFSRSRAIPPPRILSEAELMSLINACGCISPKIPHRGYTMATVIGLLASTGMRSGEVVRLDRSDVDLIRGSSSSVRPSSVKIVWFLFTQRPKQPFVDMPASAIRCFQNRRMRPSFSAREAAVCRQPACKATSISPGRSQDLMMASLCDRTISGTASR